MHELNKVKATLGFIEGTKLHPLSFISVAILLCMLKTLEK